MRISKPDLERYVGITSNRGVAQGYRPVYSPLAGYYVGVEGAVLMMALLLFTEGYDIETITGQRNVFNDPTRMEYKAPSRERFLPSLSPEKGYEKGDHGVAPMSDVLILTGFHDSSQVLEVAADKRFQRFMQTSYDKNSGNIHFTLIKEIGGEDE